MQEATTAFSTLRRALLNQRLHHAYLVRSKRLREGQAWIEEVANWLVCQKATSEGACGSCSGCAKREAGTHPDVFHLAPDKKNSVSVDAVRLVTERLSLRSQEGGRKVVLVPEAHALNVAAQNALLKTLEEPTSDTHFLLTTDRAESLLVTIRSRVQHIRLGGSLAPHAPPSLPTEPEHQELAEALRALTGDDDATVGQWLEHDAALMFTQTQRFVTTSALDSERIRFAKEAGGEPTTTQMAFSFLEWHLARALQRTAGQADPRKGRWLQAIDALQGLREFKGIALNRPLSLEKVLIALS